jgi:hypothetical protein
VKVAASMRRVAIRRTIVQPVASKVVNRVASSSRANSKVANKAASNRVAVSKKAKSQDDVN